MSFEEIIEFLGEIKDYKVGGRFIRCPEWVEAIDEAIAKLRTHPDNQPNEPLRWRSCKKEKPTEKGRYEVVCRNGDIPPYVLLGFWDPDHPGWDLYGVTHWRPLPEPPKEA